ncbi:MAG: HAD hydrolase-like protein [Nonomuraea sp.]|nr:HAD hydrolase-like protein [Nonomuraea sp.]NUP64116.1 HAD hydrolase-like protein [Nonomuraea sp.]NUP78383.1 HAD hydrolase-like protein [Nonomuraea sp.]
MGLTTALFDLDGTLIDSEARSTALWRLMLDRHAIDHDARTLVTSSRRWWAEERLAEIGVRHLIDTVVSAEDVTMGKPDPAGMRCVGVTTSHAGEELAEADLVVADLTGIGRPPFTQGSSWSGPGTEGEAHG